MEAVGQRIKEFRNKFGLTRSNIAQMVRMTYVQIGQYEKRWAVPSSDLIKRLADALNTTTDYLMNDATDKKKKLLNLFKEVEHMGSEDKSMVKLFLGSLVSKRQVQ